MKIIILCSILTVAMMIGCIGGEDSGGTVSFDTQEQSIYETLVSFGMEGPVVDVNAEKVVIRYSQPQIESDYDVVLTMNYAFTAAAIVSPDTDKIYVQVFIGTEPLFEAVANTVDAVALANEQLMYWEFTEKLTFNLF